MICLLGLTLIADAGVRVRGSLGMQAYGYQDAAADDHLWLMQSTRLAVNSAGSPVSFHLSGGYLGDNADDFSASGQGRLLSGYLEYGKWMGRTSAKLGRFFLHRGAAVGVIDGLDFVDQVSRNLRIGIHAGMMSPLTRDFEFSKFDEAPAFGGEIRYIVKGLPYVESTTFTASYTSQERAERPTRQRINLSIYDRINAHYIWLNALQMRTQGNALVRFISRFRYSTRDWLGSLEGGVFFNDYDDDSWFAQFDGNPAFFRFKGSLQRWWEPARWGAGLDAGFLSQQKSTLRLGPMVTTPWGSAGYRMSSGDRASSSGPWVNADYTPVSGLRLHAFFSVTSYEWEALEVQNDQLSNMKVGAQYDLPFSPQLTVFGEFQNYQTPRLESDRRAKGGLTWRFDNQGGRQ